MTFVSICFAARLFGHARVSACLQPVAAKEARQ